MPKSKPPRSPAPPMEAERFDAFGLPIPDPSGQQGDADADDFDWNRDVAPLARIKTVLDVAATIGWPIPHLVIIPAKTRVLLKKPAPDGRILFGSTPWACYAHVISVPVVLDGYQADGCAGGYLKVDREDLIVAPPGPHIGEDR